MRLQVAIDAPSLEEALRRAAEIADSVDIFELEAPLISRAGLAAVEAFKQAWPGKAVVAELPSTPTGDGDAELAFEAGADFVSVGGAADDAAISAVIRTARACGRGVVVALGASEDAVKRARKLRALGAKFVEFTAGEDCSATPGYELALQLTPGELAGVPFTVSGGVNASTIPYVQWAGADIASASASVWAAADPAAAARELKSRIR